MEGIKKIKSLGVFAGILLMLIGVVFIVFRKDLVGVLALITGIGIIVIGAFKLIQALVSKSETNNKPLGIIIGLVLLALGIYVLINTNVTISAVGIIIGIFAFAAAFDRFAVAWKRKKAQLKWGKTILFGLIHILFGLLMFYAAFAMIAFIVMLAGIYLLAAGIMIILSIGYYCDYK